MSLEYGNLATGWGFHNDILLDKALRILKERKNSKMILAIETVDFHQPGPFCGLSNRELPSHLRNSEQLIKSLYWIDTTLKKFFKKLKQENILDNKTLIIITADHNPHPGYKYRNLSLDYNYSRLARIPLILVTKNSDFRNFKQLQDNYYSQIDLAPTILSLLGIKISPEFMGKNIFNRNRHKFTVLGKYRDDLYLRTGNTVKKINITDAEGKDKKEIGTISSAVIKLFINNQTSGT